MAKNTNQDQNINSIVLLILCLFVLAGSYFLIVRSYQTEKQTFKEVGIENVSGLDAATKELDNLNTSEIDSGLTQLNSDSNF